MSNWLSLPLAFALIATLISADSAAQEARFHEAGPRNSSDRWERSARELRVGHWVQVRGALDPAGVFVAESLQLIKSDDNQTLIGTVPASEQRADRFLLLGQEVHVGPGTQFDDLDRGPLGGLRIKVEGDYKGPRNFSADAIRLREPGSDRIEGRVDRLDSSGGVLELDVFNLRVRIPESVPLEHEAPFANYRMSATPPRLLNAPESDLDDLFGEGLRLSSAFTLSGQLEMEVHDEREYDLDWGTDNDRRDAQAAVRLRLDWKPNGPWEGRLEGRHRDLYRNEENDVDLYNGSDVLGEAYVRRLNAFDLGVDWTVGRQDFDDEREWLFDQNLDAVRGVWSSAHLRLDLAVATTLGSGSPRDEAATNWIAYLSNRDRRRHLAAYAVMRDFNDGFNERQTNAGVRAIGEFLPDNESWLELGVVDGRDGNVNVDGWALDVGTVFEPDWLPVALVAGYALGSGDADDSDGKLSEYRQTGLQDNTSKLGGVTSVRYYGELFDPELSNLSIATAGLVVPLGEDQSASLLFHKYDQIEALDELRDSKLSPSGLSTDLGWEIDLILGSRRWDHWDVELVVGYFDPGEAFPLGQAAALYQIQVRYRF